MKVTHQTLHKYIPGLHSKITLLLSSGSRCCATNLASSGSTMKCLIFLQAWARRTFSSTSPRSRKSYRHKGRHWPWRKTYSVKTTYVKKLTGYWEPQYFSLLILQFTTQAQDFYQCVQCIARTLTSTIIQHIKINHINWNFKWSLR